MNVTLDQIELLPKAIRSLVGDRPFTFSVDGGGSLALTMLDDEASPSQEDLAGALVSAALYRDAVAYRAQRAAEYPAIGDQLDDLFKQGAFSAEMAAKIQAVKDKYPKPPSV